MFSYKPIFPLIRGYVKPRCCNYSSRPRVRSYLDMKLKSRENPVVMKLVTQEFRSILTKEVMDLKSLFDKYQYEIRIAGGAVRDLLMGQQPKDLDFATTATPDQMKDMFTTENVRMVNMTGEKHGTITPRINDLENFEVTTLRIDMVTDGRHAEVEYTTDWKLDANRRDLTINSMFLGFDGSLYDYFYGFEDLKNRKVAFVGDADVRIKEDYLRIMRYFRFYGRIAEKPDCHEEETLQVIKNNIEGLKNISGERIWSELKKTLQGNFAGELLTTMLKLDIGAYIGLPERPDLEELSRVRARASPLRPAAAVLLAATLRDSDDAIMLHARLKFSAFDRDMLLFIVEHRGDIVERRPLVFYQKLVLYSKVKVKDTQEFVREVLKYRGDADMLAAFNHWEVPRFPVGGKQLKDSGVPSGKTYGQIIARLKEMWIESDYKLTSEDLVKMIPTVVEELDRLKLKS